MCKTIKTPTPEIIEKAFAKVAGMWGNYETTPEPAIPTFFYVQKLDGNVFYHVDLCDVFTETATCNCPAFEADGFCKHIAFCVEESQLRKAEEADELREYATADRDAKY